MPLVLRLLGRFEFATGSGDLVDIKGARAQLVVARLALTAGARIDRTVLSAMLWGERADAQARASLRQAIWSIRQGLDSFPRALVSDGAGLRLDPALVSLDVAEFDRLAGSETIAELEGALALYRGDLLEGIDLVTLAPDGYFQQERRRLRDRALAVAGTLVARYSSAGEAESALRAVRRGLGLDPFDETLHRSLVDLLHNLGRNREARDEAAAFAKQIQDEFGIVAVPAGRAPVARAPVAVVRPMAAPPIRVAPTNSAPATRRRSGLVTGGIGVAVLLLAIAIGAWRFGPSGTAAPVLAQAGVPSVVVFPFHDLSVDGQQPQHAAALTADLVTDLSRISGLFVLANRPGTAALSDQDAVAEARRLGVAHVVTGSVGRSRGMIRTAVTLFDVQTGQALWSANFDGSVSELFQVQDEVVRRIVAALEVKLKAPEAAAIERIPTTNLEAYDQYMRAEEQRLVSNEVEQFRRTLAAYRRAIDLDPNFAEAHAGYARAAVEVWRRSFSSVMPGNVARKEAFEAAGRALALDPGNARAHVVLSQIQVSECAHASALTSARRAVALQPNDAEARGNLALILAFTGATAEGSVEMALARQIDPTPRPDLLVVSGQVAFADARYDDAIADFTAVLPAFSSHEVVLENLTAALALQGRHDEARVVLAKLTALIPAVNLELYAAVYRNRRTAEQNARFLDGLRRAGIPQWPRGFQGRAADRVTGAELAALAGASSWVGKLGDGTPFWQQTDADGTFAYRTNSTLRLGRQISRDGGLCQVFTDYLIDDEICGPVYRAESGFAYVSIDEIKYFDLKK